MLVYRVRSETGGHIYIYMTNVKCVLTWPCLYRPWRSVPYSVLDDHALGSGWGSRGRWPTSHVGWAWPSSWSVGIYYGSYNGPIIIPSFGSVFHSYMTMILIKHSFLPVLESWIFRRTVWRGFSNFDKFRILDEYLRISIYCNHVNLVNLAKFSKTGPVSTALAIRQMA